MKHFYIELHYFFFISASSRPQKRPTFTKGLSDITLEEGAELNVQCQVQGHPEPRVIFSRATERLEPSSRVAIGNWEIREATSCYSSPQETCSMVFQVLHLFDKKIRLWRILM